MIMDIEEVIEDMLEEMPELKEAVDRGKALGEEIFTRCAQPQQHTTGQQQRRWRGAALVLCLTHADALAHSFQATPTAPVHPHARPQPALENSP